MNIDIVLLTELFKKYIPNKSHFELMVIYTYLHMVYIANKIKKKLFHRNNKDKLYHISLEPNS